MTGQKQWFSIDMHTASTISSPGVYVTSSVHDPRKPGSAVKNIKQLRINHGAFSENQQLAFKNIRRGR